jgi:16S rRNA (uracil1498-N3)-methyltransferase
MKPGIRLFIHDNLGQSGEVQAEAGQAHYLASVMRRAVGDSVDLFNGRDGEWRATITELRRDRARFTVLTPLRLQTPEPDLWLIFAPLKRDATDLAVQKATELGVSAIHPVFTAHTNTARLNLDRLAAIATEAAEQCERLSVPTIHAPRPLPDLLAGWPEGRPLAAAIERGAPGPIPQAGALLVGPEGGFAPAELDALRRARFVSPICLGPRVLRAETAIIAGLALLQGCGWSTN